MADGQLAEGFFNKYKKHVKVLEGSLVSKAMDLKEHHIVQLGKMLDQWELYEALCEANGSLNTLGEMPKVALDVITATMSSSVLPVIASTQAIEAQNSLIWFKDVKALDTKGNISAGDTLLNNVSRKTPKGYASAEVTGDLLGTGDGAEKSFSVAVNGGESIRSQFIRVYLESDNTIFCQDFDGKGKLYGAGISGVVNYDNGEITVDCAVAPASGVKILVDYQENLEEATDIRRVTTELTSTHITAVPYALKGVLGMFQMFALKKTFGDSALADMTEDLTREINAEIGGDLISKYLANAMGTTTFTDYDVATQVGISEKQHRESYGFRRADAEEVMMGNVGRGVIKTMIVGRKHGALVSGLDGFNLLSDGASMGAHIFGTYKGVTYVRVPEEAIMPAKSGVGLFTGSNPLESAGVYAPYMPLTIEQSPLGPNPLTSQKVAGTMAGTKVVVAGYATKFNIA